MPPEILTGIMQSAETINDLLTAYAQTVPDMAPDFQALQDALAQVLAKLVQQGAGSTSPTATGPAFPAAFDRGMAGAGAQ